MKSTMIAKVEKRIMAVMLSLLLVVGVFAGVKLDVRAASEYTAGETLHVGDFVKEGDKIIIPKSTNKWGDSIIAYIYNPDPDSHTNYLYAADSVHAAITITLPYHDYGGKTYKNYRVMECEYSKKDEYHNKWTIFLKAVDESEVVPIEVISGNESQSDVSVVDTPSHTCNFQWVTTIDPSAGADGLEEYKCVYCGAVQESHSIPASVAAVKDFYGKVKDAPANGTVTYDSGKLYTISDYLLKKMAERNDVAVTVNFEYQNAKYELTFPAGIDFTPVLADEETMYGYFGVAAKLGLTVVAK